MLGAAASRSCLRAPGLLLQCKILSSSSASAATLLRSYRPPPIPLLRNSTINKPTISVDATAGGGPRPLYSNAIWNIRRRTHPNLLKAFLSDSPPPSSASFSSSPSRAARPYPQHPVSHRIQLFYYFISTFHDAQLINYYCIGYSIYLPNRVPCWMGAFCSQPKLTLPIRISLRKPRDLPRTKLPTRKSSVLLPVTYGWKITSNSGSGSSLPWLFSLVLRLVVSNHYSLLFHPVPFFTGSNFIFLFFRFWTFRCPSSSSLPLIG